MRLFSVALAAVVLVFAASVSGQPKMDVNETMATMINLNGQLCAKVLSIKPAGPNVYEVECTRYRDGTGKATYLYDAKTGKVK